MNDYTTSIMKHVRTKEQRIKQATQEFLERRAIDFAKGQWRDIYDDHNISAQELADELCTDPNWAQRLYNIAEHHGEHMKHYAPKLQIRFCVEKLVGDATVDLWWTEHDSGIGI